MAKHEHYDFTPPAEGGSGRALALALLAHALLIVALTWGVTWHSEKNDPPVQAELWATIPEPVAQKTIAPEPPPPPPPPPEVEPVKPAEPVKPPPPPVKNQRSTNTADADLAIEKKKKKEAVENEKRAEAEKKAAKAKEEARLNEAKAKKEADEKKAQKEKEEAKRQEDKKRKEEETKKVETQKQKQQEAKRAEEQKKHEEEAKRVEEQKRKEEEETKRVEEQKRKEAEEKRLAEEKRDAEERRKEQINKFKQLGAASTGPTAATNTPKSTASSGAYTRKLYDRVKPNINTFPESQLQAVKGNPEAEVIVTCGPNGKILQTELSRPSGNKTWDDTVLKGVERTGTLPLDENGSCPSKITFVFKLRGD